MEHHLRKKTGIADNRRDTRDSIQPSNLEGSRCMPPTPHATPRRKYVKVTFPNPWRTDAPLSARIHNANSRMGKAAREVSPPATPLPATTTTSKQNFFHSRSQCNRDTLAVAFRPTSTQLCCRPQRAPREDKATFRTFARLPPEQILWWELAPFGLDSGWDTKRVVRKVSAPGRGLEGRDGGSCFLPAPAAPSPRHSPAPPAPSPPAPGWDNQSGGGSDCKLRRRTVDG